ncbi:MFS transporter [Clostridium estertheticum]|uniref:MFS transporter n=1 Tax=Clostridium estertheticum TaxID=238834 RepID=UPI00209B50D6|nr:glycoside-pentoside-hexuronide (GPH):cation symporter [Clostridium estertheticum]
MQQTNNKISHSKLVPKFGMKDKIGYMFGDFGNDFFFTLVSSFLMVFYTDVFGISPAIVGVLFLVARIWDAFMDVTVGRFIDSRSTTKNGKFKPWIIRFSPFLVSFGLLTFVKIPGMSDQFYLVYALATYMIWGSLYSAVNIPYGSMASVISGVSSERASLSTFRTIGATIAGTAVGVIVPMYGFINNKIDSDRFVIIGVVFAILSMVCYSLCYLLPTERITAIETPKDAPKEKKLSLGATLKTLTKNKPFVIFVTASLVLIITKQFIGSINTYLFKDYFNNAKALGLLNSFSILTIFIIPPIVAPITRKYGKKEAASVGMLFSSVVYLLLAFLPIQNVNLFAVLMFIGNLGYFLFLYTLWAFVTDLIDYQEYLTGERADGTIYSLYSFSRKAGQAIAGLFGGVALSVVGYVAKAPHQTAAVALSIKRFALLTPAIGYFVIFLILKFLYPMTKERLAKMSIDLEAKRTQRQNLG